MQARTVTKTRKRMRETRQEPEKGEERPVEERQAPCEALAPEGFSSGGTGERHSADEPGICLEKSLSLGRVIRQREQGASQHGDTFFTL